MIRKKHLNMLKALAWSFHRSTGVDLEELNSEATLAYCEAMRLYKPGRSSVTTWTYICVQNHLRNFCHKEQQATCLELDESFYNVFKAAPPFFEAYDSLTETSREVVDMVLDHPHDYLLPTHQMSTRMVTADLMRTKMWPMAFIRKAVKNLKCELGFV